MSSDLQTCVDEAKHTFRLFPLNRGGQGIIFRTQYPTVLVKIETTDGEPAPVNELSRQRFLALKQLLPIPQHLNMTVPRTLLAEYSGYTMNFLDGMIPFGDAFSAPDDVTLENPWLEEIATQDENLAM